MFRILMTMAVLMVSLNGWATPTAEQPDRNIDAYNPSHIELGLLGFDPVGYFAEHGGKAVQGDENITAEYGGLMYRFASEENREIFLANPTKYEPTYGGWCAWAIANEGYAPINPMLFTEHKGRMHFFLHAGTKANFDNDLERREKDADAFWKAETGEAPRL